MGVGDDLYGHLGHSRLEPTLGDEAVAEARAGEVVGESEAEPAADHHRLGALGQSDVAGDGSETEAEAVEGGGGEAVLAARRRLPQRLVLVESGRAAFDAGERLIEVGEALA